MESQTGLPAGFDPSPNPAYMVNRNTGKLELTPEREAMFAGDVVNWTGVGIDLLKIGTATIGLAYSTGALLAVGYTGLAAETTEVINEK